MNKNIAKQLITQEGLKEKIINLYIIQNLKKPQVAKELGLSLWSFSKLLEEFNIKKDMSLQVAKRKETCLKKYGVDNPAKSEDIKTIIGQKNKDNKESRIIKMKESKLLKYGSENYNNPHKNKETRFIRYGDENFNNREKYKLTMLDKYGVDNGFKMTETIKENIQRILDNSEYSDDFKKLFQDRDLSIEFLKNKNYSYFDLMNLFNAPYYVIQTWVTRLELKDFINYRFEGKSHYEDELFTFISELGFEVERHNRTILNGQELDLFIKDKNVAIEFNGTYWHNDLRLEQGYHFNKSIGCEKVGIRLIHVYEYQWQDPIKKEILKSIIKNSLGKNDFIIPGRKCKIKELSRKDVVDFSNRNSLHAHRNASIYLGLFYQDELVEVMTFGKAFFSKDPQIDYECIRSITKLNTTVIGGMNKLFNYFIKTYSPKKILYYVDYNTHVGNSMSKLGFEFESYSKGGMVNISTCKETIDKYGYVFNRKPQKHKEIMEYIKEGKILTIYDAGVKRYIWKDNN